MNTMQWDPFKTSLLIELISSTENLAYWCHIDDTVRIMKIAELICLQRVRYNISHTISQFGFGKLFYSQSSFQVGLISSTMGNTGTNDEKILNG